MKQLFYSILFGFVFLSCANNDPVDLPYDYPIHCMHPDKQVNFVRKQISEMNEPYYSAFLQLISYADAILNVSANEVIDYYVPAYYLDSNGHNTNARALEDDAFRAYCTALAYCLTDEEEYGQKACYFLNTWAYNNKKYSGGDGALAMCFSGSALLFAAELMQNKPVWDGKDIDQFKIWVKNVYQNAANGIRNRENNWGDWGLFGELLSASILKDKGKIQENINLVKSRLSLQISPEGILPLEIMRESNGQNQAFWYTYFTMAPLTGSLWIIYNLTGENLFAWQENDKSVKNVLDVYLYYYTHPQEWKWSSNKNFFHPKFDIWPDNLIEAMLGIYNESAYIDYVESRRPIINPYHDYVWTFPTLMPLKIGEYGN